MMEARTAESGTKRLRVDPLGASGQKAEMRAASAAAVEVERDRAHQALRDHVLEARCPGACVRACMRACVFAQESFSALQDSSSGTSVLKDLAYNMLAEPAAALGVSHASREDELAATLTDAELLFIGVSVAARVSGPVIA